MRINKQMLAKMIFIDICWKYKIACDKANSYFDSYLNDFINDEDNIFKENVNIRFENEFGRGNGWFLLSGKVGKTYSNHYKWYFKFLKVKNGYKVDMGVSNSHLDIFIKDISVFLSIEKEEYANR